MYAQKSCLAVILFGIGIIGPASVAGGVTLGISADGKFFTINGVPTFLNGVSYYGAMTISTPSYATDDLDDMAAKY